MTELRFTVLGDVVPTARARVIRGQGTSTPRRTVEYKSKIALACRAALNGAPPFAGPVRVYIYAFGAPAQADLDNIAKGALDAMVKAKALRNDTTKHVRVLHVEARELSAVVIAPCLAIEVWPC